MWELIEMNINRSLTYFACILGGLLGNISYFLCFFISLSLYPLPFSPVNNWMSDLGNSSYNPQGAIWFNIANILSGVGLVLFYVGFSVWYGEEGKQNFLMKLTQVAGFLNAFAIVMVGIFSEDYGAFHGVLAGLFFHTNLVVLIFTFLAFRSLPQFPKWIARYCLLVAGLNLSFIVFSFTVFYMFPLPLLEWMTVVAGYPLVGLFLAKMIRSSRQG